MLDIEEIFAFQLAVLHAAPRIHGASLNLDVQNACTKVHGDVNVTVASHLSNLPSIGTDAFTANVMVLSACDTSKTGASAGADENNTADETRRRLANLMPASLCLSRLFVKRIVTQRAGEWLPTTGTAFSYLESR